MPKYLSTSSFHRSASLGLLGLLFAGTASADALRFADGEVVHGTFIRREGKEIVFQSKNLGVVRVDEDKVLLEIDNVLPLTAMPPTTDLTPEAEPTAPAVRANRPRSVIKAISRRVEREIVGWWEPWKGRLAASLNVVNDASERSEYLVEARANREWPRDKVSIEGRYEYRKVDAQLTSDQIRGVGNWRHDFGARYFTSYRPEIIRDRLNTANTQPFPYFMIRQQVGAGLHLWRRDNRELRFGVAQDFYNVWSLVDHDQTSERANSFFVEAEAKFPWRVAAKDRLVWHLDGSDGGNGWEHEFEVTKKITDAVSFGLRQEFRRNHPDQRVIDSERLRLLLTYDF